MKNFTLFLFLCLPTFLLAQKNFQDGYVVTLKGDTLRGYIDHQEWSKSPSSINFKTSKTSNETIKYTVNDIYYFELNNKEAFRAFTIKISLSPVKLEDITVRDTSFKTDKVFLKVIYSGKICSLYSYTDMIKTRYYLHETDKEVPDELIYREYHSNRENPVALKEEAEYQQQIIVFAVSKQLYKEGFTNQIEKCGYNERDIKQVVFWLNGLDKKEVKQAEHKGAPTFRFFVGAGMQNSTLAFKGDHDLARNGFTSACYLPHIKAGVDLLVNPYVKKLLFRVETGYQVNRSEFRYNKSAVIQSTYEFSFSTVTLSPQVVYAIYNKPNFKIPVGVGYVFAFSNYTKKTYQEYFPTNGTYSSVNANAIPFKKQHSGFVCRAGVVIMKNYDISFVYLPSHSLTSAALYSVNNTISQIQITYIFNSKKSNN